MHITKIEKFKLELALKELKLEIATKPVDRPIETSTDIHYGWHGEFLVMIVPVNEYKRAPDYLVTDSGYYKFICFSNTEEEAIIGVMEQWRQNILTNGN